MRMVSFFGFFLWDLVFKEFVLFLKAPPKVGPKASREDLVKGEVERIVKKLQIDNSPMLKSKVLEKLQDILVVHNYKSFNLD
jgi:hypothetical protein